MSLDEQAQPQQSLTPQRQDKIGWFPILAGCLSFVPYCGVPFGIYALLWGLRTKNLRAKLVALIGVLGISVTAIIYGSMWYNGYVRIDGKVGPAYRELAEENLTGLVTWLETYRVAHGAYPATLLEVQDAQGENAPVLIIDPTNWEKPIYITRFFYYELTADGDGYFLLSVGADGQPFTADDVLPLVNAAGTGLKINPDSQNEK